MEPLYREDGELFVHVVDNRPFSSSLSSLSPSQRLSSAESLFYFDGNSPKTCSSNRTWSSDNFDTESWCTSDSFDSSEFDDRQRNTQQLEVVHYSKLEGTRLASLDLAASRLPLNDSRLDLLMDTCEAKDQGLHEQLSLEFAQTPAVSRNDGMARPMATSYDWQVEIAERSKSGPQAKEHGKIDKHDGHMSTALDNAHTHDAVLLSSGAGELSLEIADQAPTESLNSGKQREDEKKEHDWKVSGLHPDLEGFKIQINDCFEIRSISLGGFGSFARKDLKRGDVILREQFIIRTNSYTIDQQFESLDLVGRRAYLCLHPHWPRNQESMDVMNAICHTNAFHIGGGSAVFPIAARFNHKCSPMSNIDFDYDRRSDLIVFTVKAEKIAAGQELTLSYGGNPRSLHERYGFFCQCGACEGWSQEQDDELQKLNWGC